MGVGASRLSAGPRSLRSVYIGLVAVVLVVFAVSAVFFVKAITVEEREGLAQNDAIARSVAASIEAREHGYLNVLRSYAGRFLNEPEQRLHNRDCAQHLHLRRNLQ